MICFKKRFERRAMRGGEVCLLLLFLALPGRADPPPDYHTDVAPILRDFCAGCHNDDDWEGEFSVETFRTLMIGGEDGAVVVPGSPEESLILKVLTGRSKPRMPPKKEPQPSPEQIMVLQHWIQAGANGPAPENDLSLIRSLTVPDIAPQPGLPSVITAASYSHDGRWLALARYGVVELLDAGRSGVKPVRVITGLPGKVNALHWSREDRRFVTATGVAGLRGEAILWQADSGEKIRSFSEGHSDVLSDAELSPDGTLLATSGYDRQIILWRTEDGAVVRTIQGHNGAVYDLAFSPDGTILASASGDETVKLWKVSTGERLDTLNQPQAEQYSVAFTPDGNHVVAAGADNRIRLWRLVSRDQPEINPLQLARFAHEEDVLKIALTTDGSRLLSTSADRSLKLWSLPDLELVEDLGTARDVATDLAVFPRASRVAVARWDGTLSVVRWANQVAAKPVESVAPSDRPRTSPASFAESGATIAQSTDDNHDPASAQQVNGPAEIKGVIAQSDESDWYRFHAEAGEEWTLEVNASRSKSPLDSRIEVLDARGEPIERVVLQAVRDSWFTFRGKDAETSGDFRLQNWREMELNEYLYANGEVVRLWHYPRGPDSGFLVYPGFGSRHTFFGTTALSHPLGEPCYIVRPFPAGAQPSPNGLPVFRLYYENDDDPQRRAGTDSKLLFQAPHEGEYLVRIHDVRGFGGSNYLYTLHLRPRRPDFKMVVEGQNPSVSPGSGREFTLKVEREDGFEGEIRVDVTGLPEGFSASTPVVIEAGQDSAIGVVYAAPGAAAPAEGLGKKSLLTASAVIRGADVSREVGSLGEIKLGAAAKLLVEILPDGDSGQVKSDPGGLLQFTIAPGETITALVKASRVDFSSRIEFGTDDASRNLPHGVYIDNIGLNGLLIVEGQNERQFFITAAPGVAETTRMFHLRAKGDGGQVSRPAILHVRRPAEVAQRP